MNTFNTTKFATSASTDRQGDPHFGRGSMGVEQVGNRQEPSTPEREQQLLGAVVTTLSH